LRVALAVVEDHVVGAGKRNGDPEAQAPLGGAAEGRLQAARKAFHFVLAGEDHADRAGSFHAHAERCTPWQVVEA
jgi:hypothetical protein